MIIKRLPRQMDPNYILLKKIAERDLVCPFCGARNKKEDLECLKNSLDNAMVRVIYNEENYPIRWIKYQYKGYATGRRKKLFTKEKKREWNWLSVECKKCGGRWYGDPYPQDILEGEEYEI